MDVAETLPEELTNVWRQAEMADGDQAESDGRDELLRGPFRVVPFCMSCSSLSGLSSCPL